MPLPLLPRAAVEEAPPSDTVGPWELVGTARQSWQAVGSAAAVWSMVGTARSSWAAEVGGEVVFNAPAPPGQTDGAMLPWFLPEMLG